MLKKTGNPIHLMPVPLQKLPQECQFDHRSAFGASFRFFLSGLTPLAFSIHSVSTRQWYYLTHSWRSVHEHQGIFHSPVGLHTACLRGRPPPSPCSSAWGRKVPSFQYRRGEALHRTCQRRGYVLAERDVRTLFSV